jgi:hypothetical protein
MWKSRTMRALTTLSWALLPFCLNCHAQETPELDKVADRIVQKLQKAKKQKVVVIDFPLAGQKVTALGQILANQLTSALTKRMTPNDVVTRAQLSERIGAMGLSPDDLREREIAFWLSGEAGATVTVFGSLAPREEKFVLSIELVSIKDSKLLLKTETDLPKNEQIIALLGKPPDWPPPHQLWLLARPLLIQGKHARLMRRPARQCRVVLTVHSQVTQTRRAARSIKEVASSTWWLMRTDAQPPSAYLIPRGTVWTCRPSRLFAIGDLNPPLKTANRCQSAYSLKLLFICIESARAAQDFGARKINGQTEVFEEEPYPPFFNSASTSLATSFNVSNTPTP